MEARHDRSKNVDPIGVGDIDIGCRFCQCQSTHWRRDQYRSARLSALSLLGPAALLLCSPVLLRTAERDLRSTRADLRGAGSTADTRTAGAAAIANRAVGQSDGISLIPLFVDRDPAAGPLRDHHEPRAAAAKPIGGLMNQRGQVSLFTSKRPDPFDFQ